MAGADSEVPIADLSGERVRWYHSLRTRIALWSGLLILLFLLAVNRQKKRPSSTSILTKVIGPMTLKAASICAGLRMPITIAK